MHYYNVAPTKIIRLDSDHFTYSSEKELKRGQIVNIEVGKKYFIGVIINKTTKPIYETKDIANILDIQAMPHQLVDLAIWISKYYNTPLATTLQTILPRGIDKKRRDAKKQTNIVKRDRTNIVFNKQQIAVINSVSDNLPATFLLQGITGSGKTEVYIELAKRAINVSRSVLIIVPEIALTSQLVSEFSLHFNDLLVTHSKMTESNRHNIWTEALNSKKPKVIIGPRSALFTPFKDIGLIVVDEAHEPSLKQDQSPKYSALRVATILGRLHSAKVIFGSATPNIIDRYLAEKSNQPILLLDKVARENSLPPTVKLIDMTKRNNFKKHRFISDYLIEQINDTLSRKKQTLIFHNRRGSTTITLCNDCGWASECDNCHLPLTLHIDRHYLHCHVCGVKSNIPNHCPQCQNVEIIHKGIGTKLVESELHKLFSSANIARFDADNNNDETLNNRYDDLYNGDIDIIIGTQIVAKGLDLPHLRTVGVIQADVGLSLPDFNSSERTFQLLSQAVGRVGRNHHKTHAIIQTYQPNHPSIKYGLTQNYETFYEKTLVDRKINLFPPFIHLLKLTCIYKTEATAIKNSKAVADKLKKNVCSDVKVLGPSPAFYERQGDTYRWQLVLKSPKREHLIDAIKLIPKNHWQYDLDPASLL